MNNEHFLINIGLLLRRPNPAAEEVQRHAHLRWYLIDASYNLPRCFPAMSEAQVADAIILLQIERYIGDRIGLLYDPAGLSIYEMARRNRVMPIGDGLWRVVDTLDGHAYVVDTVRQLCACHYDDQGEAPPGEGECVHLLSVHQFEAEEALDNH